MSRYIIKVMYNKMSYNLKFREYYLYKHDNEPHKNRRLKLQYTRSDKHGRKPYHSRNLCR